MHTDIYELTPLLQLPNLKCVTLPDKKVVKELIIDRQMNTISICTEYNVDALKVFSGSLEAYLKANYITLPDGRIVIQVLPIKTSISAAKTNVKSGSEEYEDLPF